MNKSNNLAAESYLEKSKSSGLMNEKNRAEFEAVAEMLRHSYSLERAKAQVARAEAKRSIVCRLTALLKLKKM